MPDAQVPSEVNVGCRALDVMDVVQGARVPVRILYPTRAPERLERFGPYALSVTTDAPVEGEQLPLVLISHGNGGSGWRRTWLAPASWWHSRSIRATAAPTTASRARPRISRTGTATCASCSTHFSRTRGWASGSRQVGSVIGHSMGGYAALAVAGGRPSCFPNETSDGQVRAIPVVRDPRVRALVLLAPASPWFMAQGALADVDLPILMRTAEHDEHAPAFHAEIILRGVPHPQCIDHRVVPNAGHFSFQSPFPPAMSNPGFPPSQDPKGFDRVAFQPVLHAEILTFLRESLGSPRG